MGNLGETIAESMLRGTKAYDAQAEKATEYDPRKRIIQRQIDNVINPRRPSVRMVGDELYQYDDETKKWNPTGVKKPPKKEKIATKRDQDIAKKSLMREFLGQQYTKFEKQQSMLDKYSPTRSKAELILEAQHGQGRHINVSSSGKRKLNVQGLFKDLGVSTQDFIDWANQFDPDKAKAAFPSRDL